MISDLKTCKKCNNIEEDNRALFCQKCGYSFKKKVSIFVKVKEENRKLWKNNKGRYLSFWIIAIVIFASCLPIFIQFSNNYLA